MHKVCIIDVIPKGTSKEKEEKRMEELMSLVNTLGGIEVVATLQKRTPTDYRTFVWPGKLEEIAELMKEKKADVLIIGNNIRARQIYVINEELILIKAECRDRVDLILKIFDKHADSTEARLQIELASIKHMWPRIFGMSMELGRQAWGIGNKGIGETNTEVMRRHLQQRRISIEKKLKEYNRMRGLHRERRERQWLKTIGLVWYTNAGKTTLLNNITKKDAYADDKLFATLGTTVGEYIMQPMPLENENGEIYYKSYKPQKVLVSDTIGFIRDLPPKLIAAFASTLEDSIHSHLLLHVIDASDPDMEEKIEVVDDILDQIEATQPRILVFNKIDKMSENEKEELKNKIAEQEYVYPHIYISAWEKGGIEELLGEVQRYL